MVIQFEFENKKKKKFRHNVGSGIFLIRLIKNDKVELASLLMITK